MSWPANVPDDVRELATVILTEPQLAAWKLELRGWGKQRIADHLEITKGSVSSRLAGAHLKLLKAGIREDEFGRYYVEKEVAA